METSSDQEMNSAIELREDMGFTANTETNRKRGLLSEEASQGDRRSTETPRILATGEPGITVHTQLRSQLWTEAYDCLKRDKARLVEAYERILSGRLYEHTTRATAVIGSRENDMEKMKPEQRQEFLKDIIETTLKRLESGASTKQRLNNSKEKLEIVKKMIGSITVAAQEVAFAWVGVCLALKFLLEPVTPQGFDRHAAAFLISRMNLYWHMSALLIDENRTESFTEDIQNDLKNDVIELYMSALLWQMKTICACYQQEEELFLHQFPTVNDWNKEYIQEKEEDVRDLIDETTTWEIAYHFQGLVNITIIDVTKLRDMHLDDVPTVCTACGNLDSRIWGKKSYSTYVTDVQHASSGCSGCMVIVRGVSAIVKPLDQRARLTLTVRKEASCRVRYHWGGMAAVPGTPRNLEIYAQPGVPSPWPAIRPGRSLRPPMRHRSMELVSEWFNRCSTEHSVCRTRESILPTRVVYVGNGNREPYLYETSREGAPYTALSYCWGSNQKICLTTTTANLRDRMDSIPMSALPKTFADAVLLTRKLGIEYIWIDSLCIIQDDSEDWAKESARMADVYQNAALTISADGASDGSKGLFQTIEVPVFEEISIPFQSPTGSGHFYARETTLTTSGNHVHVIGHKKNQPLRQRGWALQEWLLSNRVAHFTTGELLWECNELQFCQCQVTSQSPTAWEEQSSRTWSKLDYYKKGQRDGESHCDRWRDVVRHFTRRQLTIQTDRLPALSGLAAFTKSNAAKDYIAGLWKSDLLQGMLWKVDSDESERFEDYYAPSWSWASIKGAIGSMSFQRDHEFPPECKILELFTVPATDNPFGPLKSGFVKIQGPVGILPQKTKQVGRELRLDDTSEGIPHRAVLVLDVSRPAFEVTSADEIPFLIVKRKTINTDTIRGIALKKMKDGGQFMRVGFVHIACDGRNWESWIVKYFKVQEQILTIV